MIRFFRSIRQKFLQENRVTRYLIYALGEIVLVMIGILLALQVNNWNNQQQREAQELDLLKEMRQNLANDLDDCRSNIRTQERIARGNQAVLTHLEQKTPFHDSLKFHFGNLSGATILTVNTTAYENLKSMGVNLISNDTLRMLISQLYAERYGFLAKMELEWDGAMQREDVGGQIYGKVIIEKVWNSGYPINDTELMADETFKGVLRMNLFTKTYMASSYKAIEEIILKLIELIDQELNSRAT